MMEQRVEIGPMRVEEAGAVSALAIDVFNRFVAPDYGEQGRITFGAFAASSRIQLALENGHIFYVARIGRRIAGFIEIREDTHIAMFFVGQAYQGRGIGKALMNSAKAHAAKVREAPVALTVHAAPGTNRIYERLGFQVAGKTREEGGIIYTPMVCRIG